MTPFARAAIEFLFTMDAAECDAVTVAIAEAIARQAAAHLDLDAVLAGVTTLFDLPADRELWDRAICPERRGRDASGR